MRALNVPIVRFDYLALGDLCGFTTPFANPEGVTPSRGDKGTHHLADELMMTAHSLDELLENFDGAIMHYANAGMSVFVTVRGESVLQAVIKTEGEGRTIHHLLCSITAYDHTSKNFIHHSPERAHLIHTTSLNKTQADALTKFGYD